ncbi:MAG TPA: bifunctional precorrin-2 dehydrogenase/sirohydrochlorin ferrochelatase [Candidatus Angelobacter sp.]|nr:bifunctional precorrin-2 dehydrogenase/sirohydrochlorin ferrochelatase [Candidatus Angelobacter sp.]
MALYPIFLKLEGHKVLIVGGGAVAEQKIEAVLRSATDVTVIAPEVTERIAKWAEQKLVRHVAGEYRPGMAKGYFLVISCTDSEPTNRAVYGEARASGALSNAVDDPEFCDFYAPAVVSRGDFQIAISTGGHSPILSQEVRKDLERQFGPEYESWTAWLGRMRADLRRVLPRTQRRKELLHLLTVLKPQRALKISRKPWEVNHGTLQSDGTGSQTA